MPVDILVGGQGGDEGKGKIAASLALATPYFGTPYQAIVRVPSPQAGHSIHINGNRIGLAQLPCGIVNKDLEIILGAGSLISVEKLLREIRETEINPQKLKIDYKATIVTPEHVEQELENNHLMKKIGSVGTGVGPCRNSKIMRKDLIFAKDVLQLQPYLADTKKEISKILEKGGNILFEGDHGAKLDLVHGEYPMVTSRIVNASGFLSEAGIGPKEVREVYVILKPYTTRVAAGPLEEEIVDEKILDYALKQGGESGTVSKRTRRIGCFEWNKVQETIRMNTATKLAITHLDIPDFFWKGLGYNTEDNCAAFLKDIENNLCLQYPYPKIKLLSFGPRVEDTFEYWEYSTRKNKK